jgi:hypothetical protein
MLFAVATLAGELFCIHEVIELLVISGEVKVNTAFLTATREDAI